MHFAELHRGADRVATRLSRWGAGRGDRVGLWLPKSLEAVTAIHGILRAGASYVPADPTGPAARAAAILAAAGVKAAVVAAELAPALRAAWPGGGPMPRLIVVGGDSSHAIAAGDAHWADVMADDAPSPLAPMRAEDDLAYILFTSGSTGQPKGVMLSHANALTFLDWCHDALGPWSDDDRFASHAPLHFDLSVFDLFAACQSAATLVLIGEALGKDPGRLGDFLAERADQRLVLGAVDPARCWPSAAGSTARASAPRLVLFAGEVFPIEPLRRLRAALADGARCGTSTARPRPTSARRIRSPGGIPIDREARSRSAGSARHCVRGWSTTTGATCSPGTLGELVIAGPGVMRGYFGRPDLTESAFLRDADGTRWYRTGDLVSDDGRRLLRVPRPSRPDGQEAGLPHRAGRDRGGPLPPRRESTAPGSWPDRARRASRSRRSLRSSRTRRSRSSP